MTNKRYVLRNADGKYKAARGWTPYLANARIYHYQMKHQNIEGQQWREVRIFELATLIAPGSKGPTAE